MNTTHKNNPIQSYEFALAALHLEPGSQHACHQAVLALARLGSLEFAIGEYARYGLDKVGDHEDIMALGARLSKDLYLTGSGDDSLAHAQESSDKYEAAFAATNGYYSGVNAATMAFLADAPADIVVARANIVRGLLPSRQDLSPEDHYFIEATRAECFLLLGDLDLAKDALSDAIKFDPLNYIAHASTLKQLGLILDKKNIDPRWLKPFKPPRPVHFAGHIWRSNGPTQTDLQVRLSDAIQQQDIGFAYGALAAGADIEIAEALLDEGVELNVVLPCVSECFVELSVRPYGEEWVKRFDRCLERAQSVVSLPERHADTGRAHNLLGGRLAMGQTIMRGWQLGVSPFQLLINDPKREGLLTASHRSDWHEAGAQTVTVTLERESQTSPKRRIHTETMPPVLLLLQTGEVETYPDFESAMKNITENAIKNYCLHFMLQGAQEDMATMMQSNPIETALVSESVAGYVALKYGKTFDIVYAGSIAQKHTDQHIRCYALRAK